VHVLHTRHKGGICDGVTAGWIEDRGVGFSEYAIGAALRKLHAAGKVKKITDGCHIFWHLLNGTAPAPSLRSRLRSFGSLNGNGNGHATRQARAKARLGK
jgi:hypothetical protein